MEQGLLEKKYLSFKNGVEEALRKFTSDIGDNVRGMREEINQLKQDIKKKSQLECNKCKDKFISKEKFENITLKIDSLENFFSKETQENLTEIRNELNDMKIEVSKRNIDSEKVYPRDTENHINVKENRKNNIDIEMEIENLTKEKLKNENELEDIEKRIQSLEEQNENIRKIVENTNKVSLQK